MSPLTHQAEGWKHPMHPRETYPAPRQYRHTPGRPRTCSAPLGLDTGRRQKVPDLPELSAGSERGGIAPKPEQRPRLATAHGPRAGHHHVGDGGAAAQALRWAFRAVSVHRLPAAASALAASEPSLNHLAVVK